MLTRQERARTTPAHGPGTQGAGLAVTFVDGLYGFPRYRRFTLHAGPDVGVYVLRSADLDALTFVLIDAAFAPEDPDVAVPASALARLGARSAAEVRVMLIVRYTASGDGYALNLRGPVAFNPRTGRAVQLMAARGVSEPRPWLA